MEVEASGQRMNAWLRIGNEIYTHQRVNGSSLKILASTHRFCLTYWAGIFLSKPLLYALYVKAMSTIKFSHLTIFFVVILHKETFEQKQKQNTIKTKHNRWKRGIKRNRNQIIQKNRIGKTKVLDHLTNAALLFQYHG